MVKCWSNGGSYRQWKSNIWNECDYEQDAVRIRTAVNAGLGRVMQFLPSTL